MKLNCWINLSILFSEKTEVFLEVFGNAEIRSLTEETLKFAASQLSLSVTETLETPTHSCLNTTLLKVICRTNQNYVFVQDVAVELFLKSY